MLVLLDRDGVINKNSDEYIKCPDEWIPIDGSLEAIGQLTQANIPVSIITNQSGITRNYFTENRLHEIHHKMLRSIQQHGGKIDNIYFCPHQPKHHCSCRKPKLDLFHQAASYYKLQNWDNVIYIGDSECDYQSAKNIGCQFILISEDLKQPGYIKEDNILISRNLYDAVNNLILKKN